MKTSLLLIVASLATVLGTKPATEEVKTDAAAGRYNRRGGYGGGGGYGYGYPSYGPGYWQPLVQDRFVCDLDASVLLVVDSHHHHHHNRHHHNSGYYNNPSVPANRAVRVKCAEVANHDEDSCNFCCQQTARRDTSLANDKLFGFLAITKTDDDKTFTRTKRGADESPEDDDDDDHRHGGKHHGRFHKVDPTYVVEADWKVPNYHSNVKCVCCAPRTNSAAQNPSTYNNAAASPPAASNPYGSANTFNTQPVPANPVNTAAQQPWMDTWQQNDSGANWSNTAASTGAASAGANWNTAASSGAAPAANWNSGSSNTAAAPSTGANWNTAGASSNAAPNTWSDAPAPAAPAAPSTNWASNTAADTWGAASDAAAPAPPPAATQAPVVVASNTY